MLTNYGGDISRLSINEFGNARGTAKLTLIDRAPQVTLLSFDLYENFVDEERIAVTIVISLQSPGVRPTEFYAPKANRLLANGESSLGQQIFNISMAEFESLADPNCITDNRWRKSIWHLW